MQEPQHTGLCVETWWRHGGVWSPPCLHHVSDASRSLARLTVGTEANGLSSLTFTSLHRLSGRCLKTPSPAEAPIMNTLTWSRRLRPLSRCVNLHPPGRGSSWPPAEADGAPGSALAALGPRLFTLLSMRTVKTSRSLSGSLLSTRPWLNSWTGWLRRAVRFELDKPTSFPLRGCSSAAIFSGRPRHRYIYNH